MQVLKPLSKNSKDPVFFLFGKGLIGGAFLKVIMNTGSYVCESFSSNWQNWKETAETFDTELEHILSDKYSTVEIVWSAGKTSFSGNQVETNAEWEYFENIAGHFEKHLPHQHDTGFTLISSAGAMFEGQRLVNNQTQVKPLRPYGRLKKNQEELLSSLKNIKKRRIFRLSSVYGYISPFNRMGLITNLIQNGLKGHITHIIGNFDTLRDYIFADDVGLYIAKKIRFTSETDDKIIDYTLAAGKPVSILEAVRVVEFLLKKKLLIHFDLSKWNAANITYSPMLLPDDWTPRDLMVGVKLIISDLQRNINVR